MHSQLISFIRAYSAVALYAALSLFAILLVFANFTFWPYVAAKTSTFIILLQIFSGVSAAITGFRYVIYLMRQIKQDVSTITVDQIIYLPHLLPIALCLMLSSYVFKA